MENDLRLFVPSFHPLLPFLRVRSQNMPLWLELNQKLYVLLSWHFHEFRSFASFCTLSSQILHSLLANDTVLLLQFPSYIILIQMKMNLFPPPF